MDKNDPEFKALYQEFTRAVSEAITGSDKVVELIEKLTRLGVRIELDIKISFTINESPEQIDLFSKPADSSPSADDQKFLKDLRIEPNIKPDSGRDPGDEDDSGGKPKKS